MIYYCKRCSGQMEIVEVDDRQEWSWVKLKCTVCGRAITIKEDKGSKTV